MDGRASGRTRGGPRQKGEAAATRRPPSPAASSTAHTQGAETHATAKGVGSTSRRLATLDLRAASTLKGWCTTPMSLTAKSISGSPVWPILRDRAVRAVEACHGMQDLCHSMRTASTHAGTLALVQNLVEHAEQLARNAMQHVRATPSERLIDAFGVHVYQSRVESACYLLSQSLESLHRLLELVASSEDDWHSRTLDVLERALIEHLHDAPPVAPLSCGPEEVSADGRP